MAYNEQDTTEAVVREIAREFADVPVEILIVDDGSTDRTTAITDQLAEDYPGIRVVHHQRNQGLGGVYRTGFQQARGAALTFLPADGQYPASIPRQFLPLMADHDLVLGYVERRNDAWFGRLLSRVERALYRGLFGPLPRFQSVFMVRRELLDQLPLVSRGRGWAIVMEMILRAQRAGFRIASRPTPIRPRMSGVSKVSNLSTIWNNFCQMLALSRQL